MALTKNFNLSTSGLEKKNMNQQVLGVSLEKLIKSFYKIIWGKLLLNISFYFILLIEAEEWQYAAMVVDRLLLIVFSIAFFLGTMGILLKAPSIYDDRKPIANR
ncbi:acetylcholine receptor subunit alpha-like [Brachionus plicatilis]|uniref:Acetylcholine receptor subunit alpha-like n=1 Tax=Brachionus plicatilis TaxID=10195 RepID=A0A3M7QBT7_BRAPC|nr:acetylcholine receptor subunit alpha-like [Brachionus plicatilis]